MPAATLESLIDRARRYADQVDSEFRSDEDIADLINVEWAELYDILVTLYEDFFVTHHDVTAVSDTGAYDLSAVVPVIEKLRGVSYVYGDSDGEETPLMPFTWEERGGYSPNALDGTVRVWYVPRVPTLVAPAVAPAELEEDEIDALPTIIRPGWEDFIARGVAAKLLMDEESPSQKEQLAEKEKIRKRIEGAATNRDANAPREIARHDDIDAAGSSHRYALQGLTLHLRSEC